MNFAHWMQSAQTEVEIALSALLPSENTTPEKLHQAMRYAVLNGGKRIRPLLTFAAGFLSNAPPKALLQAACAVEMIHAYSLVHDDLPSMDNDHLRRGKPTCHIKYDEATALLVGDALQTQAFLILSRPFLDNAHAQIQMLSLLAQASGSEGMAGGQAIDLASVGKMITQQELEIMHAKKTGALIEAAVFLGALCGEPLSTEKHAALRAYTKNAGLLFQVIDDVLDCTQTSADLGKTAGKDASNNKPTYVRLLGLEEAKNYAAHLHQEAKNALVIFGESAQTLLKLTDFMTHRSF